MVDFLNTYKGKKVLITGHTGFKGSWLSITLKMLGAEVYGISLEAKKNDNFNLCNLADHMDSTIADIRDLEKIKKEFNRIKPDIVFHLAAQSLVLESYENPTYNYETNVIGTVNILEAIRLSDSVAAALMITTDKCYRNKEWIFPYRETDELGGKDPYSASKACAELVTRSYYESFFKDKLETKIASVRAGNVIGGGDWCENRIVPDLFRSIQNSEDLFIRNPNAIRPWQFVLEPLFAYLKLCSAMLSSNIDYEGGWNFGPYAHDFHSVKDLMDCFKNYVNFNYHTGESNNFEANILKLDISKAISKLNWKPALDFKATVKETAEGYLVTENFYKNRIKQIENYINIL